jgi:addiction module HigA family antidote
MARTTKLIAARKFSLEYFILEQLDMYNWSKEELALEMGISENHLNNIFNKHNPISTETARLLGKVFKTSPKYWINIDTEYRTWIEQKRNAKSTN